MINVTGGRREAPLINLSNLSKTKTIVVRTGSLFFDLKDRWLSEASIEESAAEVLADSPSSLSSAKKFKYDQYPLRLLSLLSFL